MNKSSDNHSTIFIRLIITIFLLGNIQCSKHKMHSDTQSTKNGEQKQLYQCPMHPQITSHNHGENCPICGMNLVKVELEPPPEEEMMDHQNHGGHNKDSNLKATDQTTQSGPGTSIKPKDDSMLHSHAGFRLSLEKRQMIGVKSDTVKRKLLFKKIKAAGSIAYDPDLFTARIEYQEALKQFLRLKNSPLTEIKQSANSTLSAAKTRLKVLGLSDSQIRAIKSHKSLSEDLLLSDKNKKPTVYAEVYEVDLPFVKAGQSVAVRASFLAGKILAGKVLSVDRIINRNTRTAKVRILLNKTNAAIRPDAYVDVVIYASVGEHLAIPFDSILDTGLQAIVFVVKGNGYFEPRNVSVRLRAGNDVAVDKGLSEGEKIVTSANFLIDSESRLKAVIRGAQHAH